LVYTPEEKTNEKEGKFYITSGLLTNQWKNTETAQNIMSDQEQENNYSLPSYDNLMTPQFPLFDNQNFYNSENSVYNPQSNLGGSVFAKDPADKAYSDYIDRQLQKEKTAGKDDQNEYLYYAAGFAALAFLVYQFMS